MNHTAKQIMRQQDSTLSPNASNSKFGGIPLMAFLLLAGIPLGRELTFREIKYADQLADEAFQRGGQIGLENTWVVAATLGLIYALAILSTAQQKINCSYQERPCWSLYLLILSSCICLIWSSFPLPILMNFGHLVGVTFVAISAGRFYSKNPATLLKYIAYALCLNVTAHICAVFLIPDTAIDHNGRWAGLATNPNSLGLISSLALWSIASAIFLKAVRPIAGIALLCPALLALFGSGSVTSIVCALIGVGFLVSLPRERQTGLGLAVSIAVVFLFGIAWALWTELPLNEIFAAFGRSSDFSGRVPLWQQGIDAASLRPILGWGYDNHASVMLETPLPYGHFHNGFIDLAVRGGFLGVILLIGLMITYINRSLSQSILIRNTMISYLMMFLIYNLTEVSVLSPKNPGWLLVLVMIFISQKAKSPAN